MGSRAHSFADSGGVIFQMMRKQKEGVSWRAKQTKTDLVLNRKVAKDDTQYFISMF